MVLKRNKIQPESYQIKHDYIKIENGIKLHVAHYIPQETSNQANFDEFLNKIHLKTLERTSNKRDSPISQNEVIRETPSLLRKYSLSASELYKTYYPYAIFEHEKSKEKCLIYNKNTLVDFEMENVKQKAKPILFFFHGVGGSVEIWKHQIEFFASNGYEIVALDSIGHGKSDSSEDSNLYTYQSVVESALKIFDTYSKDDNILIGHSYGYFRDKH